MTANATDWQEWEAAKRFTETMERLDREQAEVEATCAKLADPNVVMAPAVCLSCNRRLGWFTPLTPGSRVVFYCQRCDRFEVFDGRPE